MTNGGVVPGGSPRDEVAPGEIGENITTRWLISWRRGSDRTWRVSRVQCLETGLPAAAEYFKP